MSIHPSNGGMGGSCGPNNSNSGCGCCDQPVVQKIWFQIWGTAMLLVSLAQIPIGIHNFLKVDIFAMCAFVGGAANFIASICLLSPCNR
jgi:hypothetical protein